jgi:hypothetical protein
LPGTWKLSRRQGHFPITIADLLTGVTSISRKNPNSRSQIIDAAEKIAVNSTDIDRTPG